MLSSHTTSRGNRHTGTAQTRSKETQTGRRKLGNNIKSHTQSTKTGHTHVTGASSVTKDETPHRAKNRHNVQKFTKNRLQENNGKT